MSDLAVFVAVAESGSFVAGARLTSVTTSSVSRAVARLEDELGVVLLRRTSRRVALTDEGRQLLLHAAPHVEGLGEALARTADRRAVAAGRVRITAPVHTGAVYISRALAAFALAHTKIDIELDASNAIRDLVEDGFDFGVRVGPVAQVAAADFIARRLWQSRFGLFATRALAKKLGVRGALSREQLERGPCVALRASARWTFRAPGGEVIEVRPAVRFAVNDPRAAIEAAREGVGIVLAPLEAASAEKSLVALHADFGEPEPRELFIVYPSRRLLPERVRLTIDWLSNPRWAPGTSKS